MILRNLAVSALATGSLCLAAAAAAQQTQPAPDTPPAQGGPATGTPAPAAPAAPGAGGMDAGKAGADQSKLSSDDRDFIEGAAHAGNAEIEASKLALEKAASPDVKSFAQKMIDDHTKVGDELKTLAQGKGVTPPDGPSLVQTAKIKALGLMSGENFDKMYASQIAVSAHEDAVELFKKNAAEAEDPDLKAFASKTLPALEEHLRMGKELQQKVGGEGKGESK